MRQLRSKKTLKSFYNKKTLSNNQKKVENYREQKLANFESFDKIALENSNSNKKVRPQDDFNGFVNNDYLSKCEIPPNHCSWGPWAILSEKVDNQVMELLETLEDTDDSELMHREKVLKMFWQSGIALCRDSESESQSQSISLDSQSGESSSSNEKSRSVAYNKAYNTLKGLMKLVDSDKMSLAGICGNLLKYDLGPINFAPTRASKTNQNQDLNDVKIFVNLMADGLTFSDLSLYETNEDEFLDLVKNMNSWISLDPKNEFAGLDDLAQSIFELEKELAGATKKEKEEKEEEKIKVETLKNDYSNKSWQFSDWLKTSGVIDEKKDKYVMVESLEYLRELVNLASKIPLKVWKAYLRFGIARKFGTLLKPKRATDIVHMIMFEDNGKSDVAYVMDYINDVLGDVLGSLYVKKHFSNEKRENVMKLVNNLKWAFRNRILKLSWLSKETKDWALFKLEMLKPLIGYPENIDSYSEISLEFLDKEDIVHNYMTMLEYTYNRWLRHIYKVNKGVKSEDELWSMHPHEINAYCDFEKNEIVFPAAILQEPFYTDFDSNNKYNDTKILAQNYGSIGAIIGHEITHAFDDEGSKYDSYGKKVDWWLPEDRREFEERTSKIVQQFNEVRMFGMRINGQATQGENIADLGGLLTSYDAMMHYLKYNLMDKGTNSNKNKNNDNCHDDYSSNIEDNFIYERQQFFISWALTWRELMTEEALRDIIENDTHAPPSLRINMPLSNMKEFYECFHVKKGDRLYREEKDRVKIW